MAGAAGAMPTDTIYRGYSCAGGMAAVCGGEDQGGQARGTAVSAG